MESVCSAVSDPCLRRSVRRAGALLLMLVREIVRGVFVGDVQLLSDSTACRGPPRAPGAGNIEGMERFCRVAARGWKNTREYGGNGEAESAYHRSCAVRAGP